MDVGQDGETKGKFIRTARKSQENKYKQPLIALVLPTTRRVDMNNFKANSSRDCSVVV